MRCNWRNERTSSCLAIHTAWGCSALPGCTFPLAKLFLQQPWNSLQSQCLSHYKQSAEGLSVIPCIWPKMVFLGLRLHLIHHPGIQMMLGSFQKSDLFWEDKICQLWGFGGGGVSLRLWKPFPRETGVVWNNGHLVGPGAWPVYSLQRPFLSSFSHSAFMLEKCCRAVKCQSQSGGSFSGKRRAIHRGIMQAMCLVF